MSTGKSGDTERRYSDICGAENREGEPCKLPAGWGTPGSGGGRCRYHGGCSTGPSDTSHLEGNDFAEDNPGGGAPELNTNAQTANGIWSDWRKVYARLPEARKDYVDRMTAERVETVEPYTPEMDPARRERLARELSVLNEIQGRIDYDLWAGMGENPAEDARGPMMQVAVEIDGETYTVDKPNPALGRGRQVRSRQRTIREELNLWDRYQEPPEDETTDGVDWDVGTLVELLKD